SCSRASSRPEDSRYSVTTWLPGASEDFTHGFRSRPRLSALRATRPAPTITSGFDVLVQDVMAAITTEPLSSSKVSPSYATGTPRLRSSTAAGAALAAAALPSPVAGAGGFPNVVSRSWRHWDFIV